MSRSKLTEVLWLASYWCVMLKTLPPIEILDVPVCVCISLSLTHMSDSRITASKIHPASQVEGHKGVGTQSLLGRDQTKLPEQKLPENRERLL